MSKQYQSRVVDNRSKDLTRDEFYHEVNKERGELVQRIDKILAGDSTGLILTIAEEDRHDYACKAMGHGVPKEVVMSSFISTLRQGAGKWEIIKHVLFNK